MLMHMHSSHPGYGQKGWWLFTLVCVTRRTAFSRYIGNNKFNGTMQVLDSLTNLKALYVRVGWL